MKLLSTSTLAFGILAGTLLVFCHEVQSADSVLSVHGSGTTNCDRCFGSVMEEIRARAKLPIRMTYRSVGSSVGLEEFINGFDATSSATHWGAGEIPVSTEDWNTFRSKNVEILQLPTLFGAVSFFHSIPGVSNLNMTSCLLARIFTRDLREWNHPDILRLNPNLEIGGEDTRIRVARREDGGSSTKAITQYLNKACPYEFPESKVGSLPEWPKDTVKCRGSAGMNDCIGSRPGTIGYNDASYAIDYGLQEISVRNKFGKLVNSQLSAANGGIGAIENGVFPENPTDDFGHVSLLDQGGEWTWPITLLTYLYVRADLSFIPDPNERSLLVAFIKALYDPDFVTRCNTHYGFNLANGPALELGKRGIELLESKLGNTTNTWKFEGKAEAIVGADDLVLSSNRPNFQQLERSTNMYHVEELMLAVAELRMEVAALTAELEVSIEGNMSHEEGFTAEHEDKLMTAFIVAIIALTLVVMVVIVLSCSPRPKKTKNRAPRWLEQM